MGFFRFILSLTFVIYIFISQYYMYIITCIYQYNKRKTKSMNSLRKLTFKTERQTFL